VQYLIGRVPATNVNVHRRDKIMLRFVKYLGFVYRIPGVGPQAKRMVDELVKNGGKIVMKPPGGFKPQTVTPGNISNIIKGGRGSPATAKPTSGGTSVARPKQTSPSGSSSGGTSVAKPKQTSPSGSSSGNTSVAGGGRSTAKRTMKDITPSAKRLGTNVSAPKGRGRSPITGIRAGALATGVLATGAGKTEKKPVGKNPNAARKKRIAEGKKRPIKDPVKKGPMTLTTYLNTEIKKRGSSVTAEKKGSDKYTSISAAKKAGSLYYKNPKTGKIMAAVYKEDLKK